jgi:shikimate dehydrogenase
MITGQTRLVGLIGMPVADSLSPRMQNAAFAARGLAWAYVPLPVEEGELEDAVRGLAALGFVGANVTAPYKPAVAQLFGGRPSSVNTIVVRDGGATAHSTDAAILEQVTQCHKPVVIGKGGAGQAFLEALPGARVFSRQGEWPPDVRGADLVVNATSARDEVVAEVEQGQTLVDLPYPGSATASAARANGACVLDGLEVLVAQGAAAFELWTGLPAPVEVMRRALGLPV